MPKARWIAAGAGQITLAGEMMMAAVAGVPRRVDIAMRGAKQRMSVEVRGSRANLRTGRNGAPQPRRLAPVPVVVEILRKPTAQTAEAFTEKSAAALCSPLETPLKRTTNVVFEFVVVERLVAVKSVAVEGAAVIAADFRAVEVAAATSGRWRAKD
jgi:hypothetical protein